MHYAAKKDSIDVGRLLLAHGAVIDPVDSYGKTPLDVARAFGSTEIGQQILLSADAAGSSVNLNAAFAPTQQDENYDYPSYDAVGS